MTPQVFISGMHIDDDGTLVIDADEAAEAGVKSIEFIEGTPESRIKELEARAEAARNAQRTAEAEHLAVCAKLDEAMADVRRLRSALTTIAEWPFDIMGDCVADARNLALKALDPAALASEQSDDEKEAEEYFCGYNTVTGAFHKPGCTGECGIMNPGEAVERRRIQRRKAKGEKGVKR